ncbi:MAG: cbb3-type cytochrome oxidase assembly protein CcoS [Burkholderiaceae bacterium]|jgi:cbb3-type cytochrome oxidase maturation protein
MEVFPILVGISLVVVGLVVWIYFRMSSSGQFDDLDSPAQRILLDDDKGHIASKHSPADDSGKP